MATAVNLLFKVLSLMWTIRINIPHGNSWKKFFCHMIFVFYVQYSCFLSFAFYAQYMIWTVDDNCYYEIGGEDIEGCLDYWEHPDEVIRDLWIWWAC